jgi:hypothetical protein
MRHRFAFAHEEGCKRIYAKDAKTPSTRKGVFLIGSGGRISPSALRAPVALATDRDAPASLRLRVNLLSSQVQTLLISK